MKLQELENPKNIAGVNFFLWRKKYINVLDVNISILHSIICPVQNIKVHINIFPYTWSSYYIILKKDLETQKS